MVQAMEKEKNVMPELGTTAQVLQRDFLQYPNRIAMRKKKFGIWQEYTWADVYEHVKNIALGFKRLGLEKEDCVIIIGNNNPELFWVEWAVQAMRGVAVCLYVDTPPNEMKFYIGECEAKFIVAEDQEQTDKFIKIHQECPSTQRCIYWNPNGLWFYEEPYLLNLSKLEELGTETEHGDPGTFERFVDQGRGDDLATIVYTPGTTGVPKGIMLEHNSLLTYAKNGFQIYPIDQGAEYVSFSSPAWAEQFIGLSAGLYHPLTISFAEEPETTQPDIREIGPKFVFCTSRLWEDLAKRIQLRLEGSSRWKRKTFSWALNVGYQIIKFHEMSKPIPFHWKLIHLLASLPLRRVKDHLGLSKVSVAYTAGSLIAPELMKFFRALGIPLCSLYSLLELGILSGGLPTGYKYETIGKTFPNVEAKIENGELCFRTSGMARGYLKDMESFRRNIRDSWYHTGDKALIDKDGDIVYLDRIGDLIKLKDKGQFSPQFIETRLRFSSYIKDAIVFGREEKEYLIALLTIDFNMIGQWAASHKIPYTTYLELSQLPQTLELLTKEIKIVNDGVPHPIKKFVSLHKEFDPDEAELTRTHKLKRAILIEKYKDIIEAMYAGKDRLTVETTVTYQDGMAGVIKCALSIQSI